MNAPNKESEKSGSDWIELVTGRIGKITALVGAIGGGAGCFAARCRGGRRGGRRLVGVGVAFLACRAA